MPPKEWIKFSGINSRYLGFTYQSRYFILDRKPVFFLGYLFYPINWLFKRTIIEVSEEQYNYLVRSRTQSNNKNSGLAVAAGSLGVILARKNINHSWNFPINWSPLTQVFLWIFILIAITSIVYLFNRHSRISLLKQIQNLAPKQLCYVYPRKNSFFYKFLLAYVILYLVGILSLAFVFIVQDWLFLIGFQAFIVLFIAYAYQNISSRIETEYSVVPLETEG